FIKANKAGIKGKLHADVSGGWKIALENTDFQMAEKGEEVVIPITITPGTNTQEGHINVYLDIDGMLYNKSMSQIEYDHIPFQFILSDASAGLVNIDLKKIGTEIGYIPGAGDGVAECLRQIGYTVTELTEEKLSAEDLSAYSAIVAGIRAYNTNDRLSLHYKKLMEYINKGGNYIVQYNTNSRLGPMKSRIGPYPFTISRERVTDEQAKVRWNNGQHPILNFPNRITTADFEGWVQERGVYYASEIDPHYESILLMNDPGEKETNGSLIVSRYGKGNFVYTGLSFFRELPAGVPGAYRLFVNLLSIPKSE
ncbi:MAG: LmbE family protein, partial [Crocinitomicaceae bacterium]|nr:LmbE family protein [Crocinitomicaceae bacterium]